MRRTQDHDDHQLRHVKANVEHAGFSRQAVMALCLFAALLLVAVVATAASGQTSNESDIGPSSADLIEAIESGQPQSIDLPSTNAQAAESLPHQDLGREEAVELLQAVFEDQLQAPAGIFDDLDVERLLAPDVAVIGGERPPELVAPPRDELSPEPQTAEASAPTSEKEELRALSASAHDDSEATGFYVDGGKGQLQGAKVLDASIPISAEAASGDTEAIDLSLQRGEGEIQPTNPLVEVEIPDELGEGIELPGPEVTIKLAGAPDGRTPSVIDQSVGFLPNVATDTDLAVAPTPTGVETLTQLRSPDAPRSQTYELDLPPDSTLTATEAGGATVTEGGEVLVGISPPTAIDAAGTDVPVDLDVQGHSLTLSVSPDESTKFPVLVDPLYQTYEWKTAAPYQSGICNSSFTTETFSSCMDHEEWSYETVDKDGSLPTAIQPENRSWSWSVPVPQGTPGIYIHSSGTVVAGSKGSENYTVPRYFTDWKNYGARPTSFISQMTLSSLDWNAFSSHLSPYLFAGIWDNVKEASVSYYGHEGLEGHSLSDMNWQYQFPNPNGDTNAKIGYVTVNATETQPNQNANVYVGSASIQLADVDIPGFGSLSGPSQWMNQTALPINFTVSDSGLGMYAIVANDESPNGSQHAWKTSYGCIGVGDAACPRTWQSGASGAPTLKYEPALMSQGIQYVKLTAEDPVGNKSPPAMVQVKVDHTVPSIALSGSMTEQATLGTKRPRYTLIVNTTDGTTEQPQSGVAKASIELDGKVVANTEPGCATKSCAIPIEMSIESSKFAAGQHTVKVNATDAVGLTSSKTLTIELQPSPPTVALSGSMTEQASLGTSRPRYKLKVDAIAQAGLEGPPPSPSFNSSFGSAGTGNGQFAHPGDIAIDAKGNLWVVDENNNRIEQFNEKGEYVAKFGSLGSANGQFKRPTSLAIDAKGNVWVTDAGNNRLQQFNEKGEFLKAIGAYGSGSGQFSGPEGIAIDPKGNIWVSDTYNARLQKFNEKGEFIKVIGTRGSATGQLVEPTGIDVGPGNKVWVTDWANNRVEVYSEAGEYVRQFGSEGAGNGQFKHPDALTIDTKGNVWVGDQNNSRIQQFNQSGEYITQFGSAGSGNGQFSFGYPMGIAVDSKGNLWVTDTGDNRVQKWLIPGYAPIYASSFGAAGSGGGQFNHPAGIAVFKGNVWVVDENNNRVEKFSETGEYRSSFGMSGSGNGQFSRPTSIAIAANGNIWVTDAGNNRLQQFNEKGEFLKAVGAYGTGNLQFSAPEGITIDQKGNLWIADTYNGRLQELNEKGEFIKVVSSKGSALGQLGEPTGLDIAPDGSVWVADWQNDRVSVFNEAGTFVRQFGVEGTGNGQFKRPDVVDVDAKGNVWVGDQNNSRIQQFNQSGEYITQFGTAGTAAGQFSFSWPMGIASDGKGNLWISDTANNRVQKWTQVNWRSEIITQVSVDGQLVNLGQVSCSSEQCPITREWTLNSSAYSTGKHTVTVEAVDGLGNQTTKTLSVEIQPDMVKPQLEVSGELFNAPEGWVEQEAYGLNTSASDNGYGVTSIVVQIDGEQITSSNQSCADGGCAASLSKSVNMAPYSGGAHVAEITVTDGAGNSNSRRWTVNVDPEGHVSAVEAEETLEAADATADAAVVAPTDELISAEERADGNEPSVVETEGELQSRGVPDPSAIGLDPGEGFTVVFPSGTLDAKPVNVSNEATDMAISEENAALSGNTAANVDMVVRPKFDGVMTFSSIRDVSAPYKFSWQVDLAEGQSLRLIDPMDAEIVYEDGTRAVLISAEEAHDAVGATVPTSLSVSEGNILTLFVAHRDASYVYPVVAGAGWEGGFTTEIVVGPKDDQEVKEEHERILREEHEALERQAEEEVGEGDEPPGEGVELSHPERARRVIVDVGPPEMYDWEHRKRRSKVHAGYCNAIFGVLNCDNWHTWEVGTWFWNGTYHHVGGFAWRGDTVAKCYSHEGLLFSDDLTTMGWSGPDPAPYGYGKYLNLWCNFHIGWFNINDYEVDYYQLQDHLYGDGYQGQHIKDMAPPYLE
jgi:tripartite motif-containing protein 71